MHEFLKSQNLELGALLRYKRDGSIGTVVGQKNEGHGGRYTVLVQFPKEAKPKALAVSMLERVFEKEAHDELEDELDLEVTRVEMLETELRELRLSRAHSRKDDIHAQRIAQAIEYNTPIAEPRWAPLDEQSDSNRHTHNLLLSDLHYGERVDPEQVNGLNEYDIDICERRVDEILQGLISFKDNRPYPIQKLVVSALGDNCSGGPGIHDEIRENSLVTVSEQAHDVGMLLGYAIEQLVPYYEEIELVGVSGNHPRMARPHASKNVFDNFDWIGYKTAEVYLRHYDTVSVFAPRAAMAVHEISGNNVLLWHGDGVRTTMPGVPWGGVMRRWNELKRQYAANGTYLSCVQVGHFHQANVVQGGEILMNGSVIGLNEYGLKNFGSGQSPCQLLVTWDDENCRQTDVSYLNPE